MAKGQVSVISYSPDYATIIAEMEPPIHSAMLMLMPQTHAHTYPSQHTKPPKAQSTRDRALLPISQIIMNSRILDAGKYYKPRHPACNEFVS